MIWCQMRNDDLNNYARIFPGLPLWIAIALDKLRYTTLENTSLSHLCVPACNPPR